MEGRGGRVDFLELTFLARAVVGDFTRVRPAFLPARACAAAFFFPGRFLAFLLFPSSFRATAFAFVGFFAVFFPSEATFFFRVGRDFKLLTCRDLVPLVDFLFVGDCVRFVEAMSSGG